MITTLPRSYVNHIRLSGPGIYYEDLGGVYVDTVEHYRLGERCQYLLILSPIDIGESMPVWWDEDDDTIEDLDCFEFSPWDGVANCELIPENQSQLKRWMNSLTINNFNDWYVPAIDELAVIYKKLPNQFDLSNSYWSSTNHSSRFAWAFNRFNSIGLKVSPLKARAVRRELIDVD